MSRKYDIIVWGATGFTGKLVCEYFQKNYPDLRWAIAGRSSKSLYGVKALKKLSDSVGIIVADISDASSLKDMTSQSRVVLTTAGPFDRIGTPIVKACVESGTSYCDITGESQWIRKIINKFNDEAAKKNIKIVNCCGFDCIPSDLSAQMLVEECAARSVVLEEIRFVLSDSKGGASGGTLASVMNMIDSCSLSELLAIIKPFYLNPSDRSISRANSLFSVLLYWCSTTFDPVFRVWTVPYVMQTINVPIVNRSNAVMNFAYGKQLKYSERQKAPAGLFGGLLFTVAMSVCTTLLMIPFLRAFVTRFLPKPGEGPRIELLDSGYFTGLVWARGHQSGSQREVIITGSVKATCADPGYRATAKMVAESALCLALDGDKLPRTYGILTPASAMGTVLRERLISRGITFCIDN